ncbi:hypothetical protein TWF694_003414 [Orbilia ellipsospora]|uniref:F-box domain-containing protein n=1 Tax=Orbilia ellipsospora TaxID=2528407 RepID=A0AAV9WY67_9PEZI
MASESSENQRAAQLLSQMNQQAASITIKALPVELQTRILSFLPVLDQIPALQTCSLWRSIILTSPYLIASRYNTRPTSRKHTVETASGWKQETISHGILPLHELINTSGHFRIHFNSSTNKIAQYKYYLSKDAYGVGAGLVPPYILRNATLTNAEENMLNPGLKNMNETPWLWDEPLFYPLELVHDTKDIHLSFETYFGARREQPPGARAYEVVELEQISFGTRTWRAEDKPTVRDFINWIAEIAMKVPEEWELYNERTWPDPPEGPMIYEIEFQRGQSGNVEIYFHGEWTEWACAACSYK